MKKFNIYIPSFIILVCLYAACILVLPVVEINMWFDPAGWSSEMAIRYFQGYGLIMVLEAYLCSWVWRFLRYEYFHVPNISVGKAIRSMDKKDLIKNTVVLMILILEHIIVHIAIYDRIAVYWGRTTSYSWSPMSFGFHSIVGIAMPIYFIVVGILKSLVDPDYKIPNIAGDYKGPELYIFWRI